MEESRLGRSNPRKRVSPGRERYGQGWTMKGSATIRAFINRRHTAALHSPLSETNIKMPLAMEFQHHPSPHLTRVDAFRRHVNWKYNLVLSSYDELHKWSTDDVTSLNRELWHFCGVICNDLVNSQWIRLEGSRFILAERSGR
jgi:hypothetical protein